MGKVLDSIQSDRIRVEAIRRGWKPSEFLLGAIRMNKSNIGDGFDDWLWNLTAAGVFIYKGTTKCGVQGTVDPVTYKGVTGGAWVVPGFYPDVYALGIHGASIPAFAHKAWIQKGEFTFQRDVNRNGQIDLGEPTQTGNDTAINYHRASSQRDEVHVGRYGIACFVGQNSADHQYSVSRWERTKAFQEDNNARVSMFLMSKEESDALGLVL